MFAEKTKELIEQAVKQEYDNSKSKHGEKFVSYHEAYAVLKEEIEEAGDCYVPIELALINLWKAVKENKVEGENGRVRIEKICNEAISLAMEACQIAAVCKKTLDGVNR